MLCWVTVRSVCLVDRPAVAFSIASLSGALFSCFFCCIQATKKKDNVILSITANIWKYNTVEEFPKIRTVIFVWCTQKSLLYRQLYIVVLLSTDKCTYCKSLWTKASAKCPKYKCNFHEQYSFMLATFSSADMSDIFGGGGGGLFFISSKTSKKVVKQVLLIIAHGKITWLMLPWWNEKIGRRKISVPLSLIFSSVTVLVSVRIRSVAAWISLWCVSVLGSSRLPCTYCKKHKEPR